MPLDSHSIGDPTFFLTLDDLEHRLAALPPAPRDVGRVTRIMARGKGGVRQLLDQAHLAPTSGVPGDAWERDANRDAEAQIAVMQEDVAQLISNGQPLELSGDNLWLDLDLSADHLPPGTRLRIGQAILEVTPLPHNGCRKFRARFGPDALEFVSKPALRQRNLRGIYLRVVHTGRIQVGDAVHKRHP